MTADEKHISKLAGDLKYDEKEHGSPAKHVIAHSHSKSQKEGKLKPKPGYYNDLGNKILIITIITKGKNKTERTVQTLAKH